MCAFYFYIFLRHISLKQTVSSWICPPFWTFVFRSSLSGLGRSAEKKKVETGKNRRGFRRFSWSSLEMSCLIDWLVKNKRVTFHWAKSTQVKKTYVLNRSSWWLVYPHIPNHPLEIFGEGKNLTFPGLFERLGSIRNHPRIPRQPKRGENVLKKTFDRLHRKLCLGCEVSLFFFGMFSWSQMI